jgi:bla regulator protein blaR1
MKILIGIVAVGVVLAQAQAPAEFEVASVRPNTANDRIVTIDVGPGPRFAARGYTLVLLMQRAYGVMDWNVTGGPGWIRADRYDVIAKANVSGNLTEAQLRPMLQALLADRFKLRLHKGSKEMPGYALVVGKGGPKVKASVDSEEHADTFRMNATGIRGQGISMENLARYVAGKLGLVAVDKTGLKGVYDLKVDWPEETDQSTGGLPRLDPRDAQRLAVFAALQDQLGLKLAAQKITVQMLVIDSVEKASEN